MSFLSHPLRNFAPIETFSSFARRAKLVLIVSFGRAGAAARVEKHARVRKLLVAECVSVHKLQVIIFNCTNFVGKEQFKFNLL